MTGRMLIDATHAEETRVVVLDNSQLEDFDFESSTKKQLKGNIYLAKITRVEPSLQAAFVDYGGNRHGFLAFSEIHPDYFQIPQADRDLLQQESKADAAKAAAEGNGVDDGGAAATAEPNGGAAGDGSGGGGAAETVATDADEEAAEVYDEQARRRSRLLRSYKIQEVIKRRQIMLVQVVKEERGAKGAALTTYLSLAGRYCVLMPNTPRGGGISRKISNPADRKRLKAIAAELQVPEGMGLIIRTAGMERSKVEIRRDYEYLLRLWNDIRETTLSSIAPCLIYEEANLIKRAVRDLYTPEVDEILVEGEEGYRTARRVMGMLMPSRARRVKQYRDGVPLFYRYKVEDQLDAMHSPVVQLKSGGSIVIHTTEALTAIDVNSGRSTRERHIEETALKTNLEAADEIARQLRLRDLAGLVVIDFIDMSDSRNQRAVERRVRDALKADRARIQLGRISPFGLLELSRQRLRPSFQELSSQPCPSCGGSGVVRSTESSALKALRVIEEEGIGRRSAAIELALPTDVGLYVLNQKRDALVGLESRYGMRVRIRLDDSFSPPNYRLERLEAREVRDEEEEVEPRPQQPEVQEPPEEEEAAEDRGERAELETAEGKKRRRRRRRKKRPSEAEPELAAAEVAAEQPEPEEAPEAVAGPAAAPTPEPAPAPAVAEPETTAEPEAVAAEPEPVPTEAEAEAKPKPKRRRRARPAARKEDAGPGGEETTAPAPAAAAWGQGGAPTAEPAAPEMPAAAWEQAETGAIEPIEPVAVEAVAQQVEETPTYAEEPVAPSPPPAVAETMRDEGAAAAEEPQEPGEALQAEVAAPATDIEAGERPAEEERPGGEPERTPEQPEETADVAAAAADDDEARREEGEGDEAGASDEEEDRGPEVPAGALVDDGGQAEPRRGWWSRWVRKEP